MQDALAAMAKLNLHPQTLTADGQIHRFKVGDDKGQAGWYIGYENKTSRGVFYVFTFGNFKTGEKGIFKTPSPNVSDNDRSIINGAMREHTEKIKKLREGAFQEKAIELTDRWNAAKSNANSHPYLRKKGFPAAKDGVKIKGNTLYIPLFQPDSNLIWTFQKIDEHGQKRFERGGKFKGSFHVINGTEEKTYLCEGYATGLTINFATGCKVICCFSASNLVDVAKELPKGSYVIAADNDGFNDVNVGIDSAKKAGAVLGAPVVYPVFKDLKTKPTDFNDLMALEGVEAVVSQLVPKEPVEISQQKSQTESEYDLYCDFFNQHLSGAKKDIISGEFLKFDGQFWNSPLNNLDAIKSYAISAGLKPDKVPVHLDRFILEKEKEPLIDIPEWDGRDRIQELGQFIKLKTHSWEIFENAMKEWLANVFRRLYMQGAQNRCIILKGNQGIGKDNLVRNLLGAFGCYYSKFTSDRDERAVWDQVTGSLVLHIEEFDQTGSMGVAFLKDLITRDMVTYRSPYARSKSTRKCYGSFISTVNIDAVLRDETGNRRFAVFEVESIDWSYPKDWSPQIVAQAKALYDADFKADKSVWNVVSNINAQFEQVDLVPELLSMWDARVKELIPDAIRPKREEYTFNAVSSVISDMSKVSGWKQKTILTMLKTNRRSRHTEYGTRYTFGAVNGDTDTTAQPQKNNDAPARRTVFNYATGQHVSVEAIGQPKGQP